MPQVPRAGVAPPDEDADGCGGGLGGGVASRVVESAVVLDFGVGVSRLRVLGLERCSESAWLCAKLKSVSVGRAAVQDRRRHGLWSQMTNPDE